VPIGDILSISLLIWIAIFGAVDFACVVEHLRNGDARWGWADTTYTRQERPFYFWLIVAVRLACIIVALLLFRMVLDMRT
jgi:hypothetical protein